MGFNSIIPPSFLFTSDMSDCSLLTPFEVDIFLLFGVELKLESGLDCKLFIGGLLPRFSLWRILLFPPFGCFAKFPLTEIFDPDGSSDRICLVALFRQHL